MCETQIISRHIGRIGRRTFDRRMRIASPMFVEKRGELARLLNEVDKLSDRLHDEFPTISEDDYRDHDIKVFRVDAPKNKELQATMALLSNLDFSKLPK